MFCWMGEVDDCFVKVRFTLFYIIFNVVLIDISSCVHWDIFYVLRARFYLAMSIIEFLNLFLVFAWLQGIVDNA